MKFWTDQWLILMQRCRLEPKSFCSNANITWHFQNSASTRKKELMRLFSLFEGKKMLGELDPVCGLVQ